MVQRLEAIRGGGGSVKVGTVGTISSLMMRELDTSTYASHGTSSTDYNQVPEHHMNGPLELKKSDGQGSSSSATRASIKHRSLEAMGRTRGQDKRTTAAPKRQKHKVPLEDKGNNIVINGSNRKGSDFSGKTRTQRLSSHVALFNSENTHLEKTLLREKPTRKGYSIVDIADVNCGNPAGSLSTRLKKLGLARMSQSFM